jgi:F-type H+-transporting ATPase subunit delta
VDISGGIQASLSGRYALALFQLARDEKALDRVGDSLAPLKAAIEQSDELRALLASPSVSRTAAAAAIEALAGQLDLDPLTAKFLGVLARNGRLGQLGAVIKAFNELLASFRNEMVAEVTSAHPLGDDQVEALKAQLRARYRRDVTVDLHVDKSILGGLIVKVGSQQIDGSIRTKLNSLAHAMKA